MPKSAERMSAEPGPSGDAAESGASGLRILPLELHHDPNHRDDEAGEAAER